MAEKEEEYAPWEFGRGVTPEQEEDEGPAEQIKHFPEMIKKFGPLKIAAIVGVIIFLLWFFVLRPQPASLILTVYELDTTSPVIGAPVQIGGEVYYTDSSGKTAKINTAAGKQDFKILPDPRVHYRTPPISTLTLEPGDNIRTIFIPKDGTFSFEPEELSISLGSGCSLASSVTAKNSGSATTTVSLIGDSDLAKYIDETTFGFPVSPGGAAVIPIVFHSPLNETAEAGTQISGKLRIKGTFNSLPVTLNIVEPGVLSVDPGSVTINAANGTAGSTTFKLSNSGKQKLENIGIEKSGDIAFWTSVSLSSQTLDPGEQKITPISVIVPPGIIPGVYIGVISLKTSCNSIEIPITVNVAG